MIGFEVSINGESLSAAINKGILTLILTRLNTEDQNYISLDFTGLETDTRKRPCWSQTYLKEGDQISIKVKNIEAVSVPLQVKDGDEQYDKDQMLKNFFAMKKRLEREGLI